MADERQPCCARCGVLACRLPAGEKDPPDNCPMLHYPELLADVRRRTSTDPDLRALIQAAARTEAGGYCRDTRVEEVMAYARRIDVDHLGIAFCVGLRREAAMAQDIFEANGFRVSSVMCKVGSIPKEEAGLADSEKIRPGQYEALCNPAAQARVLDEAGCGLHVLVGLCVGHDSIYFRHARAPVTVLVAKDRVTGHNPAAALYLSRSYYARLRDRD